jgi:hypothetical protein
MSDPKLLASERAIKDAASDRAMADELRDAADLQQLHTLCRRMIDEREILAKGFNAVIQGWALIDDRGATKPDIDSIAAVERIATEAIQFAREVVQALKPKAAS